MARNYRHNFITSKNDFARTKRRNVPFYFFRDLLKNLLTMLHAFSWKDGIGYSSNWIADLKASRKVKHNDFILKNPSPLLVKKLYSLKKKELSCTCLKSKTLLHFPSYNPYFFPSKNDAVLFCVDCVKNNVFCNLASFGSNFYHKWQIVTYKIVRKREREKRTLSTQKNERPLVGLFQQSETVICCFCQKWKWWRRW